MPHKPAKPNRNNLRDTTTNTATVATTSSLFLFSAASIVSGTEAHVDPVVRVTSKLPNNKEAMQIGCGPMSGDVIDLSLSAGQNCSWTVKEKTEHYRGAQWNLLIASW